MQSKRKDERFKRTLEALESDQKSERDRSELK